jgi:hypothetical protein
MRKMTTKCETCKKWREMVNGLLDYFHLCDPVAYDDILKAMKEQGLDTDE